VISIVRGEISSTCSRCWRLGEGMRFS
jgi:hypothetical protein